MSAGSSITCRDLLDFLADYLERSLSAEEQSGFDRHLSVCESCRAYLDSYVMTIRLAKTSDDAPQEAPGELIAAILDVRNRR